MPYCHKCGEKSKEGDNFCEHCGAKLKEFLEDAEDEIEEVVKKSHKGIAVFIIFVLIIGYIALDVWAASQIHFDASLNGLVTSATNLKGSAGVTSASASTTLPLSNPTPIPVILFPVTYKLNYGSTEIASGKSGMIIIGPNSNNNIPVNVDLSYIGAGSSIIQGIANALTGNPQQSVNLDFYELGIKVKSVSS